MYDIEKETDPHWKTALIEEIVDECSKFGRVIHSYIASNKAVFSTHPHL